jgi:peptide/nickel transport system substrate-binding protein
MIFIAVAALLALSALQAQTGSQPKMAAEQIYREGWLSGGGVMPTFTTTATHRLDITVNEPLVAITWQGGLKPLLATGYEMSEGGKVWTLRLRKGVKWHDGVEFTANDVLFSYDAFANPKTGSRWSLKASSIAGYEEMKAGTATSLKGVKALDKYTVRVELAVAMPLWMKLEQTYLVIFPKHILGSIPADKLTAADYWQKRIGTGPFKWSDYKKDQYIILDRNPDYYLGAPKLEKLVYQMYTDAVTHVAGLVSGQIHTTAYETTLISPNDAPNLEKNQNIDVVVMDKGSPSFLLLNHRKEWKDVRLRQALRYAIDVKSMLKAIYPGSKPALTLLPQPWTVPADLEKYEYNPAKARQLLKDAGWSGRTVDFVYHYPDELSKNLIVAIQQYLGQVGVKIVPRKLDPAALNALQLSGDLDMGLFGQGMGLDPAGGETSTLTGALLAQGYSNPKIDELFAKGKTLANQEERKPIYQEISRILNAELPHVYLWYDIRHLGFSKKAIGPREHYTEQGLIYFNMPVYNEIEKWYISE